MGMNASVQGQLTRALVEQANGWGLGTMTMHHALPMMNGSGSLGGVLQSSGIQTSTMVQFLTPISHSEVLK